MRARGLHPILAVLISTILTVSSTLPLYAQSALLLSAPNGCEVDRALFLTTPYLTGNDVFELQTHLAEKGHYVGAIDGIFGPKTESAVKEFQQAIGATPDGIFRPGQWAAFWPDAEESVSPTATSPPPDGELHIVVDTRTLRLTVYVDGEAFKSYPVAVGRPSNLTLSPVGEWKVINKGRWGGGFGTRWMGLNVPWGTYGIHGTNKPGSIGTRASAGCIRMYNRDVEELYEWVKIGTRVIILGDPPPADIGRHLRSGHTGKDVVHVQLRLQELGFDAEGADGRFGANTESAVRLLQEAYGLPQDGTVYEDVYYILGFK